MRPKDSVKPELPYPSFPLVAHNSGQWSKYFPGLGRKYFGKWDDPDGAYAKFKKEFPYLAIGLEPPKDGDTLGDLLNAYDDDKQAMLENGQIKERTYKELMAVADVVATLGRDRPLASITPLDLKSISRKLAVGKNKQPVSPVTHKRLLTYARI